jgi:hypothetical protein
MAPPGFSGFEMFRKRQRSMQRRSAEYVRRDVTISFFRWGAADPRIADDRKLGNEEARMAELIGREIERTGWKNREK